MSDSKTSPSLDKLKIKAPEVAEFLRLFANGNRLILLCHIAQKERSVTDIQNDLGIKQPGLSQQLAELRQSGLVKTRRDSRLIYYSIADEKARAVMDLLYGLFCDPDRQDTGRSLFAPALETEGQTNSKDAAQFARLV